MRFTGPLIVVLFAFVADHISKWAAFRYLFQKDTSFVFPDFIAWMHYGAEIPETFFLEPVFPFFNLVTVWNKGVSFGMMASEGGFGTWMLAGLTAAISIFFLMWMIRADYSPLRYALALVIGGALANLWDRVRFGAVADFLDFYIGQWHYPAFNLADSFICIGIGFVVIDNLFFEPKRNKSVETETRG